MSSPAISIVMSVHNGALHIRESVQSLLEQSFKDHELIIINDGSTDDTAAILASIKDERIKILTQEENLGLAASLNWGIEEAKGKYIARADADDLYPPNRLEKQYRYMEEHPDTGVLGGWLEDAESKTLWKTPATHEEIGPALLQAPALPHPAVMLRRNLIIEKELWYNEDFAAAQDYELWSRLYEHTRFANLQEVMVVYRRHEGQVSQAKTKIQESAADKVRLRLALKFMPSASDDLLRLHYRVIKKQLYPEDVMEGHIKAWFDFMLENNRIRQQYQPQAFKDRMKYIYLQSLITFFRKHPGTDGKYRLFLKLVSHSHGWRAALKSIRALVKN